MAAEEITIPLTTIYNQVLEKNEWPMDWKRGERTSLSSSLLKINKVMQNKTGLTRK